MKRILFLLLAAGGALSATAQTSEPKAAHRHLVDTTRPIPYWAPDSILSAWVLDVNAFGGAMNMDMTTNSTTASYTDGVNLNTGNVKFTNGLTVGGDVQVGYFFGKKRHWGVGTGFMYQYHQGFADLDNFHVEYRSVDMFGNTYRQVISANGPITESIRVNSYTVPLMLKYKYRFNRRLGFTADAGVLFNIQTRNSYKTKANLDYEAIYKWSNESNSYVYDNASIPDANDVLYTRDQLASTTSTTVEDEFNKLRSTGYNVALNQGARSDNGSVSYKGTIGFMIQPSLNVFLSDNVALNFGLYYMYQGYSNTVQSAYRLSDRVGDYSSVLNTVSSSTVQSYGLNVGARFFIGRKAIHVRDQDVYDPSACGGSDGKIAINGLRSNKPVTVSYNKNGVAQTTTVDTTDDNGTVTIDSLTAGNYETIVVKMKKRSDVAISTSLIDPPMTVSFETMLHPTAHGQCDGSITLMVGPHTGNSATVNYKMDGAAKTWTGTVGANNRIVIGNLCAGNYTNINVSIGNCTASAIDVNLVAPAPPPPPPPPAPEVPAITVSTPILFEFNKTVIREDSHPVIDLAVEKMNADKDAIIIVHGYTDATGRPAYNKALSIRRANAVKKELIRMGISSKRIKIEGHGAADPAASNDTPEGMAKNRRAVMHLNIGE